MRILSTVFTALEEYSYVTETPTKLTFSIVHSDTNQLPTQWTI